MQFLCAKVHFFLYIPPSKTRIWVIISVIWLCSVSRESDNFAAVIHAKAKNNEETINYFGNIYGNNQ